MSMISCFTSIAMPPPPDFQTKSIKNLLLALNSTNVSVRTFAITGISWRLSIDNNSVDQRSIDMKSVADIVSKTSEFLKSDKSVEVRLASVNLLGQLSYARWTNTDQMIMYCLTDREPIVRIRSIDWLNMITHERHERLPAAAINALMSCLNPTVGSEVLWQASLVAGEIGPDATLVVPLLENLLSYPNEKVRLYSKEALQKINIK